MEVKGKEGRAEWKGEGEGNGLGGSLSDNLAVNLQISEGNWRGASVSPIQFAMAESSSPCPPSAPPQDNSKSHSDLEPREFCLTEGQRIFIQHHLPKSFILLPAPAASRSAGGSRMLLEDSLLFIERKRGRPEGSTRKYITARNARERKSQRIAAAPRPSYATLHELTHSFPEPTPEEAEQQHPHEQPLNKEEEEASIEQVLEKTEQAATDAKEEKPEPPSNKQPEQKEETKKEEIKQEEIKQEEIKQEEIKKEETIIPVPMQEPVADSRQPKRQPRKKSSKKPTPTIEIPQVQLLQTPIRKEEQELKQFLKTAPSSKSVAAERLKFECERFLVEKLKAHGKIEPFLVPVDEVRDGAPDYYREITSPIDLQTIEFKLANSIYQGAEYFHADVRLMWANAKTYNRQNAFMQAVTEELEAYYLSLLAQLDGRPLPPRPRGRRKKLQ